MTVDISEKTAIVAIVSNNYLHFARTMLQSAKHFHPDYALYCVIVDRDTSYSTSLVNEFETIKLDKLNLPLGDEFFFQYNILELNTAVKPWAIEHLFDLGHDHVIYVDPDIYFYGRMFEVEQLLADEIDIVITPHLLAPIVDDKQPRELDIRRAGAYNFGFCALRDSTNTRNFLHWWQSKLTRDCVNDADRGLFVDQSWIDLVPGLFDNVKILRHKGYNVAYWNIAQRPLTIGHDDVYFAGAERLVFFHFSGLDPANPEPFSKHQNRFTLSTVGIANDLVIEYVKTVTSNGLNIFLKLGYGFGFFCNGESIPEVFRKLYRLSITLRERMGTRPFTCPSILCDAWPEIFIDNVSPTNAMMALWCERRDVQFEFPMKSMASILAYYRWFTVLPTAATYYTPSVISHHRELLKRLTAIKEKETAKSWLGNEKRASSLYEHILGRAPDEGGFLIYSEMCKTEAGFVRAWGEIGFSKESKTKRLLWLRMLKALLISICIVDKRASETPIPDKTVRNRAAEHELVGVFPIEADVSTRGVWVTDKIIVFIDAQSGDQISLEGIYFSESIKIQTGYAESTVRFTANGKEIYAAKLNTSGNFSFKCMVPERYDSKLIKLAIESDKFFVPKHIGMNDDARRLAWRMKLLKVGERRIFDCEAANNERV